MGKSSKNLKLTLSKKDFSYQWFSGKGAGGQHRNKHQNCFRIKHLESGVFTTGQSHKERSSNKKEALSNLVKNPIFLSWCDKKLKELETGKSIKDKVNDMMQSKYLKIEVKRDQKWVEKEVL